MSVFKRPDRKQRPWCFKFYLDGERHQEAGFQTEREARDAEAAERLKVQRQKTRMEFSMAVKLRLDHVSAYCRLGTLRNNITLLKGFADWRDLDLSEITPDLIRRRMVEFSRVMTNANANKHLIALRSVFEQAVNDGYLGRNPCRGIKFLPVERKVNYVPSTAEIEKVLALASDLDRAYLVVIWQTGARVREINNLTWEDVDFGRRQVRLWTRKKKGSHLTSRLVDLTDRAFAALKMAQWHRFEGSPYVFTNPATGKPWDYRRKFIDRLRRLAGVKWVQRYHVFRHQRASALADEGWSLAQIQEFLGHESAQTTSIYLHSLGIKR